MKNVLLIFRRDLRASLRDAMVLYILVIPFLIALVLNLLTTSTTGAILRVVIDPSVDQAVTDHLSTMARVERAGDAAALERRVRDLDDVYGLSQAGGRLLIHRQGNEKIPLEEVLRLALDTREEAQRLGAVRVTVSDVGWRLSPVKQYGGSLLAVFVTVFGAMVLMIHLVEEKQENTLAAMNVTPVKRWEYVAGKSLLGFLLPLIHVLAILVIIDYGAINYAMALVITLALALITVTTGFAIGVKTDNVIGAISALKMMFLPILGSVFGAIYLKESLHVLLWWSPFYWAFRALDRIILQTATWSGVLTSTAIILAIALAVFALLGKNIRRGMN